MAKIMKKALRQMMINERLNKMMSDKIADDDAAMEISVPVMLKGRTIHHFTMEDRSDMKKAARERELKLAELGYRRMVKAERDNENRYFGCYVKGSRTLTYDVMVHDSQMWKPFIKEEQHKGLERDYVADSDSNGNSDDAIWKDPEYENWIEYNNAKELADTIAESEIAEWKRTAHFYAGMANQFRAEAMMYRDLLKANGIEF